LIIFNKILTLFTRLVDSQFELDAKAQINTSEVLKPISEVKKLVTNKKKKTEININAIRHVSVFSSKKSKNVMKAQQLLRFFGGQMQIATYL